jgi:hypothetical protein
VRLDNHVTKEVAPGEPIFAGVPDDGTYVFYVVPTGPRRGQVIHRFDSATGADDVVHPGDEGMIVNGSVMHPRKPPRLQAVPRATSRAIRGRSKSIAPGHPWPTPGTDRRFRPGDTHDNKNKVPSVTPVPG